ncbi:ABC transporter ATP-binding protein [Rubellimicrobium roseum]|uniref:ABC transporter ATP-binding protein n=2 Tax=Rubellimicrobium roseum TaxID=687525 RepID=A0A5C4N6G1_9RHOB|nr:ABC transporter ATP-binding protein [Rubellimicrobium roseum]
MLHSDGKTARLAPRLVGRGLHVGYGKAMVLRNVDFEAAPGEMTVLVGANGCGKSTLLKTLARVLHPQAGEVRLDGQPIHGMSTREVARRLALLPQGPVAPEGLTVRELVAQGRFPHQSLLRQWSRDDAAAVERAMAATDVSAFADRAVDSLSGGQRQRCWIAMVLAQDSDHLLLDEPTTFLDLKVQVDLMALLARVARQEGRTVVLVLHEINVAAAFADRIVMMRAGQVVAAGAPREVITPASLRKVFDLEADVIPAPRTGRPVCIPCADGMDKVSLP